MIITRTPLRISFCGGGSDLPAYYRKERGAVIAAAIDKYVYLTVNAKFDGSVRASYSRTENVASADELEHELIRESLCLTGVRGGIEITSIADIPSGTGLGSSSSFTAGLLCALYAYRGEYASATRIARDACRVEIERCKKPIGKQDQYMAALGGLQYLQFYEDERVTATPVHCRADVLRALHSHLMLLYVGGTRSADTILEKQCCGLAGEAQRQHTRALAALAGEFKEALAMGDTDALGDLLHEGWMRKRELAAGITTPAIDDAYELARSYGAMGGKLLGAGGGGFLLLYAPPERHRAIDEALGLRRVSFQFVDQGASVVWESN